MTWLVRLVLVGFALSLAACSQDTVEAPAPAETVNTGIDPQIFVGDVNSADKDALAALINEAIALFKSSAFEARFAQAARLYPCLLYTSPSPRDLSTSRMPSSA